MAGSGASYVPSKFGSMEEWLIPSSYQSLLMESGAPGALEDDDQEAAAAAAAGVAMASQGLELKQSDDSSSSGVRELRSAIMGHPQYWELLRAHMNCYKVGASADLAEEIDEKLQRLEPVVQSSIGANPELDQFMVSYCNVLNACELELRKTFKEAIDCCKKLEQQFNTVSNNEFPVSVIESVENDPCSYDDDELEAGSEAAATAAAIAAAAEVVDPLAGDKELKQMLMKKYGTFIKGLTQDYLKKKKKGKLPKESRQKLMDWWTQHQDHPYPSEVQKASLAQSTGLDPKQINNWFINQRKRHWNPSSGRGESSQAPGGSKASS